MGKTEAIERGQYLHKVSKILYDHTKELTDLDSKYTGKPFFQADAKLIERYFEFYTGATYKLHGEKILYQKSKYCVYTTSSLGNYGT